VESQVEGTGASSLGLLSCKLGLPESCVYRSLRIHSFGPTDVLQCLPWRSSLPYFRLLDQLQSLFRSRLGSRASLGDPTRPTLPL